MANRKKTTEVAPEPALDQARIDNAASHAREIALLGQQREATVRAIAEQIGYQLPADATDPDLIQRDIAANMRRSVEAVLEVGRGLVVLKAACEHGSFMKRLDVLGVEPRVAQRFMASAAKFSNAASTPLLAAAGSQTKLFELLVLDDEQIEELQLTGQTGELALDDIATMSVKELRAALREAREEATATEDLLTKKNKQIDKLQGDARRLKRAEPDEVVEQLLRELQEHYNAVLGGIRGTLRAGIEQVIVHDQEHDTNNTVLLAGVLGQITAEVQAIRDMFGIPDATGIELQENHGWLEQIPAAGKAKK
jgi:uncharacterized protein YukE